MLTRADGLLEVSHRGVFLACHARRQPAQSRAKRLRRSPGQERQTAGRSVLRTVDTKGAISFAGCPYGVGGRFSGQPVEVRIARGKVRISQDGTLLCTHAIRHDRSKELGAFAIPKGRPRQHKKPDKPDKISVTEELEPMRNTGTET